MIEPTRVSFFAEVFGLLSCLFGFLFSGSGKPPHRPGEPPQVPPRALLPSTLPPPREPPTEPPQGPPFEPPGATDPPPAAPDEPPLDLRSVLALASFYSVILRWLGVLRVPRDDRQDVAQEVLITGLRHWSSLVTMPGVSDAVGRRRWLFSVAAKRAGAHRRHSAQRMARVTEDMAEPAIERRLASEEPTAEERLLRRAEAAEVDLDTLRTATTPERWSAFFAAEVEGLPLAMVAAAHGVPFGTVATRIRAAKEDLRAAILRARAQREGEARRARFRRK